MAIFTIEITDTRKLAGITAAREFRNDEITATTPEGETPATFASDIDYLQFVMNSAADSYAKQHVDA